MNRSSRLLAGGAAVIAVLTAGSLAPSPAEARPFWRPGFGYPAFYPRPAFFPRPFYPRPFYPRPFYPRPIVYRPFYVPPPVYAAYIPPPPVAYGYGYGYSYRYRQRVVHRHHRKVSHKPACTCPTQPASTPAPQQAPAPEQPPAKGS
jgi:hypothetical protein